jgi:hypothetical protein
LIREAFEGYQKVVRPNPHCTFCHRKIGFAIQKYGQRDEADKEMCEQMALEAFQAAVAADPEDRESHGQIGQILAERALRENSVRLAKVAKSHLESGNNSTHWAEVNALIERRRRRIRTALIFILSFSAGGAGIQYRTKLQSLAIRAGNEVEAVLSQAGREAKKALEDMEGVNKKSPQIDLQAIPVPEPPLQAHPTAQKGSIGANSQEPEPDLNLQRQLNKVKKSLNVKERAR